MVVCTQCGTRQKDEAARFCASCGASIGGAGPARHDSRQEEERTFFDDSPAAMAGVGVLLLTLLFLGLPYVYFWLKARSTSYKLTSRRIVIEQGIFSKRMEQVDIYRVQDYVVERPFSQRLLGTGNLIIKAADRTTQDVRIHGIRADVKDLYEKLRAATEADKRARGVRVMDVE
jgi:uncharacterized membrane protein YdbT with pleckstrin-like domain